ncbi:adenine deaminase [Neophaeococcomyces mojaviensis]|uniref:Adenine deaminase n=1 Tax=Neophaeococcomyces mojaviensis TaxID=3383035 RepID=A0ACC2ZV61_9EURO|nr:adenine deaminase [Knufia sp. JES_112]
MCQGPLHDLLVDLPKVEHHMHLEGSLEPNLLLELAKRNNIELPKDDDAFSSVESLLARYSRFTSLDDFLHYYFIGMTTLITESDFESLAYAYFQKAHSQRVVHAEVFFDPQAHTNRNVPYDTVLSGFKKAQARAKTDFGMTSELIVCLLRHIPPKDCHQAYLQALPDLQSGKISGLGLSSTEKGNHPSLFKESYDDAKKHGIKLTAHAGEEADVSYMASAVDDLGCTRIDHGIKLPQDPELLARFARDKILVTMCPLSNVELRCVKSISELPIRQYIDARVPFSINSDDPAYFGGYIQENYCAVQKAFNLTVEEWANIVTNSITLSWCNEERKDEMLKDLSDTLARYA